jgi:hypothetical protein
MRREREKKDSSAINKIAHIHKQEERKAKFGQQSRSLIVKERI